MTRRRFQQKGRSPDMAPELSPRAMRALREQYAGPIDPGYWDALERRIVARIETEARPVRLVDAARRQPDLGQYEADDPGTPWGQAFRAWTRVGAIAAGLTIVCAGAALWRNREVVAAQSTYETVLATPTTVAEALPYGVAY